MKGRAGVRVRDCNKLAWVPSTGPLVWVPSDHDWLDLEPVIETKSLEFDDGFV